MNRVIPVTPEIEHAYRKWRRTLDGNSAAYDKIAEGLTEALAIARGEVKPARKRRSPEARERMRQAALKRWAKVRTA